jgi:hypothetical protein
MVSGYIKQKLSSWKLYKDLFGQYLREIVMCIGYWPVNYAMSQNAHHVNSGE